jgi:hypothetical protein
MASCKKCGAELLTLSDGLCASCERIFGPPIKRRRSEFDLAYGGYLLTVIAWIVLLVSFPVSFILAPLLALFIVPLLFLALALSLKHWRHWPLPVMCAMTILVVALILSIEDPPIPLIVSLFAVYGLVVFVLSGRWFVALRRIDQGP